MMKENIILFFHVIIKKDEREWSYEEYRYGKDICKDDMKTFFGIS